MNNSTGFSAGLWDDRFPPSVYLWDMYVKSFDRIKKRPTEEQTIMNVPFPEDDI